MLLLLCVFQPLNAIKNVTQSISYEMKEKRRELKGMPERF